MTIISKRIDLYCRPTYRALTVRFI